MGDIDLLHRKPVLAFVEHAVAAVTVGFTNLHGTHGRRCTAGPYPEIQTVMPPMQDVRPEGRQRTSRVTESLWEATVANYDDPVSSGVEAAEAMKALGHATLKFGDKPEDTYNVLGDMLSITSSYVSVLEHLAHAHERNVDAAHDDQDKDLIAGGELARAAAQSLRRASFQIADAYRHVNDAMVMSSRIVWFPDAAASAAPDQARSAGALHSTVSRVREVGVGAPPPRSAPPMASHTAVVPEGPSL